MRQIVKTILFIVLLLLVGYMLAVIVKKAKHKNAIAEQIQSIPEFSFINTQNQNIYTNDSISDEKACLIIYYNSECEHCQNEAEQIGKQIDEFDIYQILMISYETRETILAFREKYKLISPAITFLQDSEYQFDDIFGNSPIPTSFIYNKNRALVKQYKGEVKAETLIKYLAQ
ncbi:MAG: redoxin domain-containing protein [Bacteroidales bacterium]|nr:redoxin domain-containing protein [Bacteroidales bacterium]